MGAALDIVGVHKTFGSGSSAVSALRGASLAVEPGEAVAIVGRSGSGKSTLLHIGGGLEEADQGEVRVCGEVLDRTNAAERSAVQRRHIGFVFQFFHLLPTMDVSENVELPLVLARRRAVRGQVDGLLEQLGLPGMGRRKPGELSGGQMQRVAIARALISGPSLILADEPTGALDGATGAQVLAVLLEATRSAGAALVVATHDDKVAAAADRVVRVVDGVAIADPGTPSPASA